MDGCDKAIAMISLVMGSREVLEKGDRKDDIAVMYLRRGYEVSLGYLGTLIALTHPFPSLRQCVDRADDPHPFAIVLHDSKV